MAKALSTRLACFCRSANFDEELTGNGFTNFIEKKLSYPSICTLLTILSNQSIYMRYLVEINSRKHPYISDRHSGLPLNESHKILWALRGVVLATG